MYNEDKLRARMERAQMERSKDPTLYDKRMEDQDRRLNWFLAIVTFVGALAMFAFVFRQADSFAKYATAPGHAWRLPLFLIVAGSMAYLVKSFSLVAFGSAEIACGCAAGFQGAVETDLPFLAQWGVFLGLLYLVAKGIENLDKGLGEPLKHSTERFRTSYGP